MNKVTFAVIVASVSAQFGCESSDECVGETLGCCTSWTIVAVPEDPELTWWGSFAEIWGGEEEIQVGAFFTSCAEQAYLDAHYEANPNTNSTNNYDDLDMVLNYFPNKREDLGLAEDATVDDWITEWDGDVWTQ